MNSHPEILIKKKIVISDTYLKTLSIYVQRGNNLTFCKDGEEITIESAEDNNEANCTSGDINVNVNENGENTLENISSSFLRMFQKGYNLKDKREKTEDNKHFEEKIVCIQKIENLMLTPAVCEQFMQPLENQIPSQDEEDENKYSNDSFTEGKKFNECNSSILKEINHSIEFSSKSPLKEPEILFQDIFSPKTYNYLNPTSSEHQKATEIGFNGNCDPYEFTISLAIKSIESLEINNLIVNDLKNLPMRFVFSFMNRKYETEIFYKENFTFPFILLPKTHFSIKGDRDKFEKILAKNILLLLYRGNERIGRSSVPVTHIIGYLDPLGPNSKEDKENDGESNSKDLLEKFGTLTSKSKQEYLNENKENSPTKSQRKSPSHEKFSFNKE